MNKFDSCSYDGLTSCVRYRIKRIREFRMFLENTSSIDYPKVKASIILSLAIDELEIKELLELRRERKRKTKNEKVGN